MENSEHVKSLNTDSNGKNRIRYTSTRQKAKRVSADVYRSYKRRIGVTSAASREERVHHPHQEESGDRKRQRTTLNGDVRVSIVHNNTGDPESESDLDAESTFASELDVANDRNASEIFASFYRDVWHLARSLPEVLHHASEIVDILMSYMLSPESDPTSQTPSASLSFDNDTKRERYLVNHATTDVLHLLAVLARDLRHEIHPFVHPRIVPRIVRDLLNPPVPPVDSGRQPLPLNVTVVESSFRTLSYVFRYDSEPLLAEADRVGQDPCLEKMRQYYGATLAHKRDYVRRLAAETFAPMVRKLKTESSRRKHIRRVLRALAASAQGSTTMILTRTQSDAVDGISLLLFQMARGVPGRLHSKGYQILRCLLDCVTGTNVNAKGSGENGLDMIQLVASPFLEKLCYHLDEGSFIEVWKELLSTAKSSVSRVVISIQISDDTVQQDWHPVSSILKLINQAASFREGTYLLRPKSASLAYGHDECLNNLFVLMQQLLAVDLYFQMPVEVQSLVLSVLCVSWRKLPDHPGFLSRLSISLSALLKSTSSENDINASNHPAIILARDLLPFLPRDIGMKHVGKPVLSAAANQADSDPSTSLMLLFSVASCRPTGASEVDPHERDDDDDIFSLANAEFCNISTAEKENLLKVCLIDTTDRRTLMRRSTLARLGVASRCLPFLTITGNSDDGKELLTWHKKVSKWALHTLKALDEDLASDKAEQADRCTLGDLIVAKSLLLESFAKLSLDAIARLPDATTTKKNLARVRPIAEQLLLSHPQSIWVTKSVASLLQAMHHFNMCLNDEPDVIFDALAANLRRQSHFLRLHSLQILASYPPRPYVTDHADLDLTDDLDEEPSSRPQTGGEAIPGGNITNQPKGLCDILMTLLKLESSPVTLNNEREMSSCITRVEVLGRTGRLPIAYVDIAANHMFGILNIKFSPLWPKAVRALVALASVHETSVWQPLHLKVKELVKPSTEVNPSDAGDAASENRELKYEEHHERCVAWDASGGRDAGLFRNDAIAAKEDGRVSRHLWTDDSIVFEFVWNVLEEAPELTAKNSRVIVPIFLEFLHTQYFFFHANDPDARELCLEEHVGEYVSWPREALRQHVLQKRLFSFLKVFAAVNGPQQLYKHGILLSVYNAFLSHQDTSTAQIALSCILKFKLPHIMPYSDHLKGMLKQGELRDTMLQLDLSRGGKVIDDDHRPLLLPLITRILFGRLSARVSVGKSSKETPAARRAAVLSFLAVVRENESELFPLFYLMVRSYIPKRAAVHPIENLDDNKREHVKQTLMSLSVNDISHLPDQRHEGFLNLLSAAISQLGHGVLGFVPTFMSIILTLCKYAEVGRTVDHIVTSENEIQGGPERHVTRLGTIRTLCFKRLAEIFDQYSSSVDFHPYAILMWSPLAISVESLPITVAFADKPPALLSLLVTISSHSKLIPLLTMHDQAVQGVIKCIASTSKYPVMNASLQFVDNLLTNGGTATEGELLPEDNHHDGIQLIRKHVHLLMHQFSERIGPKVASETENAHPSEPGRPVNGGPMNQTIWRELTILFRVSRIMLETSLPDKQFEAQSQDRAVMESLCQLLIPFLRPERRASEVDQHNVIGILAAIFPRIEGEAVLSHLHELSRILGPYKGRRGISSLSVRKSLALLIQTLANCKGMDPSLKRVAAVVVQLCSTHPKRVDEMDYDEALPALNKLGDINTQSSGWVSLSRAVELNTEGDPTILSPLIQCCFHLLFDEDGVVCRGAFKALKTLVTAAASQAEIEGTDRELKTGHNPWVRLIETSVIASTRAGLNTRVQSVRRLFILILAEVARCFKNHPSPNLYGDLNSLIREDDSELDFFLNITHVQIHRRSRAFQRLRKVLSTDDEENQSAPFSMQSLSNVLLPISLHPIYESKTKIEEPFALEAIATVGAIAKHLSWSKYHNTLWTALTQFQRHPEQERYLIDMICAVIDGFHFDVNRPNDAMVNVGADDLEGKETSNCSAVWRALEKRVIPKTESLLMKEKIDRRGGKVKKLRSSVVLALLKLFQKFPVSFFESRLPRLLAIICDALKNKDSDARDVARTTLAKMTTGMDLKYLPDVIRQLAVTLTEGYQLHVRMATVHTILLHLINECNDPPRLSTGIVMLPFTTCIPALMDLIQQDLFGVAREMKETEGVQKRFVKEASGSKSNDAIELICRLLFFKPSIAAGKGATGASSSAIHSVVSPLLARLQVPDVDSATIGKIRECLNRVIVGLSQNASVTAEEVFPFVYASICPFLTAHSSGVISNKVEGDESDEEWGPKIRISQTGKSEMTSTGPDEGSVMASKVVEWRPSTHNSAKNRTEARNTKTKEHVELHRVKDGASQPKLTGSARYGSLRTSQAQSLNDPGNISAVVFGLSLLYSTLKKSKFNQDDQHFESMLDPFIPLLTTCVCDCRNNDVIMLGMRCLGVLLRMNLPSVPRCSAALGTKTLDILTSSGALSNLNQELTQVCFKTLTLLIHLDKEQTKGNETTSAAIVIDGEKVFQKGNVMPLDAEQMQVLISLLKGAVVESDHHNPTLGLIKAITSRRYVSPEFYDLMDTILGLSVRSQKATLRQMSANIFIQYLVEYPMGPQRLEAHLKQVVLNIKYEYEEGRLAAIGLLTAIIEKLPIPLLEEHAQMFFLPLVLQLVNDESKECREAVAKSLSRLLGRAPTDVVQSFYDYGHRWSQGTGPLQRTSLQLFGIFVDARLEFIKRGNTAMELIDKVYSFLLNWEGNDEWELPYFALVCLEKLVEPFSSQVTKNDDLWIAVIKSLVHPHPWVKRVSSRIVGAQLTTLNVESFVQRKNNVFSCKPGSLYEVARNLCVHLNLDHGEQNEELSTSAIKSLTWIVQAMHHHPEMCFADEKAAEEEETRNSVKWLMMRLSNIAKPKGPKRREGIFKCFAAFATYGGSDLIQPYLELVLEPLHRAIVESEHKMDTSSSRRQPLGESEETTLAKDVMQMMEERCSETFVQAYANVKSKARDKREQRKQQTATEAVRDPKAAAVRKLKKHDQEKQRRKRRIDDRRLQRGGRAKRQHI